MEAFKIIGTFTLSLGVFLSGFVISEPAPYELLLVGLVAIWFLCGLRLSGSAVILLSLMLAFNIGGFLTLTQMADLSGGPMYLAVTLFLSLTSVFFASIIQYKPSILHIIFNAWLIAAIITATLGIIGYFGMLPGSDIFTNFGRAKGAFQDPNVFGPYLIAPCLYLIYGLMKGKNIHAPFRIAGLLILAIAIFLSFSRAAWGLLLITSILLIFILLLNERTAAFRLKIIILSLMAVMLLVAALIIALQIPQVSELFMSRTQLVQDYDGGRYGRFGRHIIGFQNAMEQPLGIGPMVFTTIFPEAEHNIWLKTLTTYGWLGFVSYLTLVIWTLSSGFKYLLRQRPWQPFLIIAWITFIGHVVIGSVIDTDHWRHFFMLIGLIWGCFGLEKAYQRTLKNQATT